MSFKEFTDAFKKKRLGMVGLFILLAWVFVAIFLPFFFTSPSNPNAVNIAAAYKGAFSSGHLLGTDDLGRSLFVDVIYGARISLAVGALATLATVVIGVSLGAIAGTFAGKTDTVIMRATDVFLAFPYVLGALALITALDAAHVAAAGFIPVVIAIALFSWPLFARQLRGQFLSLREQDFVAAATTYGTKRRRLVVKHLLPNALPIIIALAAQYVAYAILAEAALSFIGAGIQDPQVSWGLMLSKASATLGTDNWYWVPPGLALFSVTFAFIAIGRALQDVLGVKETQEVIA